MTDAQTDRPVADFAPADPASYSFWTEEHLRFADVDMLAHVNNNAVGVFLENGRVHLFRVAGDDGGGSAGFSWVVRRLEIDFTREIRFPGSVRVGTRVAALGNTSCTIRQGVFAGGVCCATSTTIGVCFDPVARKAMPIPAHARRLLAAQQP